MRAIPLMAATAAAAVFAFATPSASVAADPTGARFRDSLDVASAVSPLATTTPMIAIAQAGSRLVAVGLRGRCVYSDDGGKTWTQASVPVSSDLVAVRFISAFKGWATGQGGVILHTEDGGKTWSKQLDGRMLERELTQHFERGIAQGNQGAAAYLKEVKLNYQYGPEQPILDVWFADELNGFAVGTFGTIIATTDGGKTWESWLERVDNPQRLHFYSIRGIGDDVLLSSERGAVFKLARAERGFVRLHTGYEGGFFGLVGTPDNVIAYGLRGNAYRSRDAGKTWRKLDTGVQAGINGAVELADGRLVFVTQDGRVLVTPDGGTSFQKFRISRPTLLTGVAISGSRVVLSGFNGVQVEALK